LSDDFFMGKETEITANSSTSTVFQKVSVQQTPT
jgi:hypothetical protein